MPENAHNRSRSIRNRALVLAAAAAVAVLGALVNWPGGMNAEVAGGLIFLVGTVLGVDWFVARSNERQRAVALRERWAGLGGVPFRGLSGTVGDIVDGLAWLLTGAHPFDHPHGVSDRLEAELMSTLDGRLTTIPPEGQHVLFGQRLISLLERKAWCGVAVRVIDLLKWRYRERIGNWAGPMLDHEDVARVLRRMTLLDDRIGDLQAPLRELAGFPHEEGAGKVAQAHEQWFAVLAECVSLREDLHRAAITGDPRSGSARRGLLAYARHRQWVCPEDRALLDDRARWADEPLGSNNLAEWRDRRENVVITPLDATPDPWRLGVRHTARGAQGAASMPPAHGGR